MIAFKLFSAGLILGLLPQFAAAQAQNKNLKALLFEASQNNLSPSPQRFEYRLDENQTLQLGDIRIKTSDIQISFSDTDHTTATLQWPQSLFELGDLTIVDSAGKALARKSFKMSDLKSANTGLPTELDFRTSLTLFQWTDLPPDIINKLRRTAFFRFCLTRQDGDTQIVLCSPESFFKKESAASNVQMRAPYREARVEINNETVGLQGAIYLNDVDEMVRFRVSTETGAFLELNTRSQKVEFEDAISIGEPARILITAQGAKPIDLKKIRRLDQDRWQTVLSAQRPVLYMRGQGDIPLRQDFQTKGPLPQSADRVYIQKSTPEAVYSSSVTIEGANPDKHKIQVRDQDKRSLLKIQGDKFYWNLENLQTQTQNRYELEVGENRFIAHYDVWRGLPRSLEGGVSFASEDKFSFDGNLRWWFENFLGLESQNLRWGSGLSYNKALQNDKDISHLHGRLYWRAEKGLQRMNATWGLLADYWNLSAAGTQNSLLGLGVFYTAPSGPLMQKWMDWLEAETVVHFMSLSSDAVIEQNINLNAKAYNSIRKDWSYYYGVGLNLVSGKNDPKSQAQLDLGLSWLF